MDTKTYLPILFYKKMKMNCKSDILIGLDRNLDKHEINRLMNVLHPCSNIKRITQ